MTQKIFQMLFLTLLVVILVVIFPKEEIFYGYISAGENPKVEQVQFSGLKIAPSQVTIPVTVGNNIVTCIMYDSLVKNLNPKGSFTKGHKRDGIYYLDVIRDKPFLTQVK